MTNTVEINLDELQVTEGLGGISRSDRGISSKRLKQNERVLEILKNHSEDEIKNSPELMAEISGYTGRGGTKEEFSLNEYYTNTDIVKLCWNILKVLELDKGVCLEPSCGTGLFLQHAPKNLLLHGVEIDPVASTLASLQGDDNQIITNASFQSFLSRSPKNVYDIVIGNPPYGVYELTEDIATTNLLREESGGRLENLFLLGALQVMKPEAVGIMVLPYSVLSGQHAIRTKFRETFHRHGGQILWALRLPASAHKAVGTSFVTDIVVFRKHFGHALRTRDYFEEYPMAILGREGTAKRYGKDYYTVVGELDAAAWTRAANHIQFLVKAKTKLMDNWESTSAIGQRVQLEGHNFVLKESGWTIDHRKPLSLFDPAKVGCSSLQEVIDRLNDPEFLLSLDYEGAIGCLQLAQLSPKELDFWIEREEENN